MKRVVIVISGVIVIALTVLLILGRRNAGIRRDLSEYVSVIDK